MATISNELHFHSTRSGSEQTTGFGGCFARTIDEKVRALNEDRRLIWALLKAGSGSSADGLLDALTAVDAEIDALLAARGHEVFA